VHESLVANGGLGKIQSALQDAGVQVRQDSSSSSSAVGMAVKAHCEMLADRHTVSTAGRRRAGEMLAAATAAAVWAQH
jgi:hypothetical protein